MTWKNKFKIPNVSDITFNKDGKVVRVVKNGKVYEGTIGFIESQRDFIQECFDSGKSPNPELSEWKIRMYNYILNADEPEKRFDQYLQMKKKMGTPGDERPVISALGWEF